MISVIVPVYKVEQYLSACVDSILAQSYKDFELILVDDGSPDRCGEICDTYAKQDPRVRVIHQENQGLSGARNSGMDAARGDYITFVDSDDLVSSEYLLKLVSILVETGSEVSCVRKHEFVDNLAPETSICSSPGSETIVTIVGREAVKLVYQGSHEVDISACAKLYQREMIAQYRFPVGKLHEDQAFVPIILYRACSVSYINTVCYYYRNRIDSITHKEFSAKRFDNVDCLDVCIQFFETNGDNDLAAIARKTRRKVNAQLVILAESSGARNKIPCEYRISKIRALSICHKLLSNEMYEWYLSQLYPSGYIIHEYLHSIRNRIIRWLKYW